MREIRFRIWDKKEKCIIYPDGHELMYFAPSLIFMDFYGRILAINELVVDDITDNYILMQFTGLHDKNGKEIYEGDIVKLDGEIGQIIFKDGCFTGSRGLGWYVENNSDYAIWCEVIGNIYENPDLLKDK